MIDLFQVLCAALCKFKNDVLIKHCAYDALVRNVKLIKNKIIESCAFISEIYIFSKTMIIPDF